MVVTDGYAANGAQDVYASVLLASAMWVNDELLGKVSTKEVRWFGGVTETRRPWSCWKAFSVDSDLMFIQLGVVDSHVRTLLSQQTMYLVTIYMATYA